MRLQALLRMTVFGLIVIQAAGLPIEKELLRVKRKGDMDEEGGQRLHKRELAAEKTKENQEDDSEIRRKRRFESVEVVEKNDVEKYPNKMAARSSRSSREDNDITARGMERFLIREKKTKGIKQPAKRSEEASGIETEISGSGSSSISGSGLWISDSEATEILSQNVNHKRSASSLENIVAALGAVSRDRIPNGENQDALGSGSGLWESPGSGSGSDLPKFFSAAASNSHYMEVGRFGPESGNEKDQTKETNLVSDLAEEVPQDNKPKTEESTSKSEPLKQKRSSDNHIQKRDILHQFFDHESNEVIHRSRRDKIDTDLEENLASFFRTLHPNHVTSNEPETQHEPPPIPAVTSSKRKSKVITKGSDVTRPQGNAGGEGLTGLSLVKRFYRDQNMEETGQIKKIYPDSISLLKDVASKPIEKEDKRTTVPKVIKVIVKKKPEYNDIKRSDPYEPRVVHKKELPKAHVTIIEEPAVYSKTEDEGMDSSDGGMNVEEDETEPSIEIHERDIREDGYVGCYADQSPKRDLPIAVSVRNLTPKTCRLACKDKGHAYAGLQYGYLCRCGDSYGKFGRLTEEQCTTACKGDRTQICGGFFRSSVYATEGATEPTQGNFFHVESVSPLNTPIRSQAATPNYMPPVTPNYQPYMAPNPLPYSGPEVQFTPMVQTPAYFAPEEPKIIYHSETPLPIKATVRAEVVNVAPPFPPPRNYPNIFGTMQPVKKSTIARPATPKHPIPQQPPLQRTIVRRPNYLHKQHGNVPARHVKPQVNLFSHVITNPGTQTFTGTIKLKQSWIDGLDKEESAEFKILAGNIEEALIKMFKKDAKFISAKVYGFSKGLVSHNPVTVKKVVASFSLIFQRGSKGIEDKVTKSVKDSGKLFDMPVYKKSVQIQEYHGAPATGPSITKTKVKAKKAVRRSNAPKPNNPYTLELFLMKNPRGRIRRSELDLPRTI